MDLCKYRLCKNLNIDQDQCIQKYFYGSTGSKNTVPFLFPEKKQKKTAKVLRGELKKEKGKGQSTSESLIRSALLNSISLQSQLPVLSTKDSVY